tara:strand:- start:331 stop:477 length:147 start_codon:yes stop_codon:yes gene_type:complete
MLAAGRPKILDRSGFEADGVWEGTQPHNAKKLKLEKLECPYIYTTRAY